MADDMQRWTTTQYWQALHGRLDNEHRLPALVMDAADHDRLMAEKDARIAELERKVDDLSHGAPHVHCLEAIAERTRERDEARDVAEMKHVCWIAAIERENTATADLAALRAEQDALKAAHVLADEDLVRAQDRVRAAEADARALREALLGYRNHVEHRACQKTENLDVRCSRCEKADAALARPPR